MKDEEESDYDDDHEFNFFKAAKMDIPTILYIIAAIVGIALVLGCCCNNRRKGGQVLSPAPVVVTTSTAPAPYPQQQYTTPAQYHAPGAVLVTAYPTQNATSPYPAAAPYPTTAPYPTAAPYPAAGAPYPTAGAPYPTAGAPYPTAGAPYPTAGAPYPTAPSAPDDTVFFALSPPGWRNAGGGYQALPPSYEQALKQSPYNPAMPH